MIVQFSISSGNVINTIYDMPHYELPKQVMFSLAWLNPYKYPMSQDIDRTTQGVHTIGYNELF